MLHVFACGQPAGREVGEAELDMLFGVIADHGFIQAAMRAEASRSPEALKTFSFAALARSGG
jgi:hypothetical protein